MYVSCNMHGFQTLLNSNMHVCVNMHVITCTAIKNMAHGVYVVTMATTMLCEALEVTCECLQYVEQ